MNIAQINKQFLALQNIEKAINYCFEPRKVKDNSAWRRHMFFKELKDDFIKEVSSYGFSPYIEEPYESQKKDRNIMKFKKGETHRGFQNYVKRKYVLKTHKRNFSKTVDAQSNFLKSAFNQIHSYRPQKRKVTKNTLNEEPNLRNDSSISIEKLSDEEDKEEEKEFNKNISLQKSMSVRNIDATMSSLSRNLNYPSKRVSRCPLERATLKQLRDERIAQLKKKFENEKGGHLLKYYNPLKLTREKDEKRKFSLPKNKSTDSKVRWSRASSGFISRRESFKFREKAKSNFSHHKVNSEKLMLSSGQKRKEMLERLEKEPSSLFQVALSQRKKERYFKRMLEKEEKMCKK